MNDPQPPAANANIPLSEHDSNPQDRLSADQASVMAGWTREDLAAGKITEARAKLNLDQLGLPDDLLRLRADTRSREQQQLDAAFPAAKAEEFIIQYDKPGQAPTMDATQKQNLQKFDTTARTWLSTAGFSREHGNALTAAISRVVETTKEMNESQQEAYGQAEFAKLERAYGSDLEAKLQLAAKMIHELDAKQPGLKRLLQSRGIGESALVVSQLIQQAERWEIRNRR